MTILFLLINWVMLILAITIHEFSHAFMGDHLGDPTARLAGRLTLNPLPHLDPIGTVLLPLFSILSGLPILIGWAKPTPFDPFNLKNPKSDSAKIAFAGPISNVLIAVFFSLILRLPFIGLLDYWVIGFIQLFIKLNIVLAVFNLIPVHPLDGFKVVAGLLPKKYYHDWLELERYGMIFLLFLILPFFGSSPIFAIINPVTKFILSFLLPTGMGGII